MMDANRLVQGIIRQIKHSQRQTTILFTDIEDSTRYWDRHGDVKGRLMVDRHNRLVFPVIRKYRGKIVKTIGDAVMASFRRPADSIRAAIGIQQALQKERDRDKSFALRVRIGIHTGKAIVEHNDVFGDAVNVAARVESRGKGDEILVSGATAQKVRQLEYGLVKTGSFTPKGKNKTMALYRCQWQDQPSFITTVRFERFLPLIGRQKIELLGHLLATLGALYLLYMNYLRYLLADSETRALATLNPGDLLQAHAVVPWGLGGGLALLLLGLFRFRTVPQWLLRLFKGGFAFGLVYVVLYVAAAFNEDRLTPHWTAVLYQSEHLFVEILQPQTPLRATPRLDSGIERTVDSGMLLLLTDVGRASGITWNKVLIGPRNYAWVPRVLPPRIGEAEKRVSLASKFYFRRLDLYLLLAGALAMVWGWLNFRVRPV